MCGRYFLKSTPQKIRELFGYPEQPNMPARYNIAPTQPIPIVRLWEHHRQFALVRWGLMPACVKDPKNFTLLINARGETAAEKGNELLWHMLIAVISVSALIWIALGRREAAVVLIAIPVTLALTLFMFYLYGYTLNQIGRAHV